MEDRRKFYFNLQLMMLCEVSGKNENFRVSHKLHEHIQAFNKPYWFLGEDFQITGNIAHLKGTLKVSL